MNKGNKELDDTDKTEYFLNEQKNKIFIGKTLL